MESYIEVLGNNAEAQAQAIARHYGTTCEDCGESWQVKCTKELERDFCDDEDRFFEAIQEVEANIGVYINPDDISF